MRSLKEAQDQHGLSFGRYDLVVVGAGHAGCEAALAAARLGLRTALLTMTLDALANMPCNPNIGGTAKGQIVREIDALGGAMGYLADRYSIQFRMLNGSKGPAVMSPRAQMDRTAYQRGMKQLLEQCAGLELMQGEAVEILASPLEATGEGLARWQIEGVVLRDQRILEAPRLILCTGTFLEAQVVIGEAKIQSGPDGLAAAHGLSQSLDGLGLRKLRFKTGTPVRIHARSIDFDVCEVQPNDPVSRPFSYLNESRGDWAPKAELPCYLTWTNEATKAAIMDNIHRSPLYSGEIKGIGPRYCPSIEDKYVKFPEHERHHVFLEPTGLDTAEYYAAGLSTSLPIDVQLAFLHSIRGLEKAEIMRLGYAIEYDLIDPTELDLSLAVQKVSGLYCAGQINGSSGYEEAAAQGLLAGINAALAAKGAEPFILDRSEAYIGVLIDDLVTKGTEEPYRMMTARAEYRLLLRQDNADQRLTERARAIDLCDDVRYAQFQAKQARLAQARALLEAARVSAGPALTAFLEGCGTAAPKEGRIRVSELLRRPQVQLRALLQFMAEQGEPLLAIRFPAGAEQAGSTDATAAVSDATTAASDAPEAFLTPAEAEHLEIELKYAGYIAMEMERLAQFRNLEEKLLPEDLDYQTIKGLRLEARSKLAERRPRSLGQASRISGVSPADMAVLLVALKAHKGQGKQAPQTEEEQGHGQ